jgi:hypothetical protein
MKGYCVVGVVAALQIIHDASASTSWIYLSSSRSIDVSTSFLGIDFDGPTSSCDCHDDDSSQTTALGAWASERSSLLCGEAHAAQTSLLAPFSITGSGTALGAIGDPVASDDCLIEFYSDSATSRLSTTFLNENATQMRLALSVDTQCDACKDLSEIIPATPPRARVTLSGRGLRIEREASSLDPVASSQLVEIITLEPGEFTLVAEAIARNSSTNGGITGPLMNASEASFHLTLEPICVAADFDDDGTVDAGDLAILLGSWGSVEKGPVISDLDGSQTVDAVDLALLLSVWNGC